MTICLPGPKIGACLVSAIVLAEMSGVWGFAGAARRKKPDADRSVVTQFDGAAMIALDNIGWGPKKLCIPVGVVLKSGDFFDGRQRVRNQG